MSQSSGPIRVFVSYSHDSAVHMARVRDLSDRLRKEGIDCSIDQYLFSPPEGWPAWMERQIREAHFVLVACTETYARRVRQDEEPGVGLGVTWEGAIITQEFYRGQGRNMKFVPIVFDPGDVPTIPTFLGGATRYDLSVDHGYEDLYRHLTKQPRVVAPDVGAIRELPPAPTGSVAQELASSRHTSEELGSLVVLHSEGAETGIIPSREIRIAGHVVIIFNPTGDQQEAFLASLERSKGQSFGLAFRNTALLARVDNVTRVVTAGTNEWQVTFLPVESDYGAGAMEMSTAGYSADRLAEIRARRLLLDDPGPVTSGAADASPEAALLEVLIRGVSTPLKIERSPFPALFTSFGGNPDYFVAVGRLMAILGLRLGGVIEQVVRFDLRFVPPTHLEVFFEGRRPRRYSNADPTLITVVGRCALQGRIATSS